MFAIIFIWTPPHFWSLAVRYKDDYQAADVPMLPVVASMKRTTTEIVSYTVALVAVSFLLGPAARQGGHLVNVSSAAGLIGLPWHAAYSASKFGVRGLSEVLRFDLARYRIGVSVVVPGAVRTPLVNTVEIAGVDREDPEVSRWVERFSGHAVSPEKAADKILAGVARNRFLIYTSSDIRALYAFKRLAWWPYSVAMRQVNVVFTRALRPAAPTR